MTNACCEWEAEIVDDSVKQLFQADEAYSNGNKAKAVAYVRSQVDVRLPAIVAKARRTCGRTSTAPSGKLSADLRAVEAMMLANAPTKLVHAETMRIDKRYALGGYYRFYRCSKK